MHLYSFYYLKSTFNTRTNIFNKLIKRIFLINLLKDLSFFHAYASITIMHREQLSIEDIFMDIFLYSEINLFAAIILLIIYVNIRHKKVNNLCGQMLYMALLVADAILLFLDTCTWVFDGIPTPLLTFLLTISYVLLYIFAPIICSIWILYVDFLINRDNKRIKKLCLSMIIPILFSTLLSILSAFGNVYFYIDANSIYHRGQYYILPLLLCFSIQAYSIIYIIINRKRIHRPYIRSYLLFSLPPTFGGIIQSMFYGLSLVLPGATLSILFVFINIQNEQMNLDYLTGLFNRRQLDFYLHKLLLHHKSKIVGIMVDLNSFKSINDSFGHTSGDEALKYCSQILKDTFHHQGFISRFGGDEFVILLEINDENELPYIVEQLRQNLIHFSSTITLPYQIDFSIGAAVYNDNTKMSAHEFLNHIDDLMYQDKPTVS